MTERAAARLPEPPDVLELDINSEDDLAGLAGEIETRWGGLDGALHAIAFAPADAIGGRFMETPPESAMEAFKTSAYSFKALAQHLAPLMDRGSFVGLDFDASVAWPSYDWRGVSKAALEAVNRYLARELGPRGIRSNLISAGRSPQPPRVGSRASISSRRAGRPRLRSAGTRQPDSGRARRPLSSVGLVGGDQRRADPRRRRRPCGGRSHGSPNRLQRRRNFG